MGYPKSNPYVSNPYLGNPYMPRFPMPPYGQPMKSPEQYQADLLKQLQPNLDVYNQQYSAYQQQQTIMNNSGQYVKVSSYEEVKQVQAPSDGRPVIIIDDTNGFLYSKKFDNGQEYIKAFRLVPNEIKEEKPPVEEKPVETKGNENDTLKQILEKLNNFDSRLTTLEGKNDGNSGHVTE